MGEVKAKRQLGQWMVGWLINKGGQGEVHVTWDKSGKQLAIKTMSIKGFQKKKLERAKQEINIIRRLKGAPNIVTIHDDNLDGLKDADGTQEVYYVMDFARHGSLGSNDFYIGDVEVCLRLFREILRGISAAHKANVVHRDLKPENILLFPNQRSVRITDFGISLLRDDPDPKNLTEADEILGPAHFMAPEQYKSPSEVDARSDIYSLGKILYFMLTGKGKMFRESLDDLAAVFEGSNPYLPLIQEKLINNMVVADQNKRYSGADEVIDEVDSILSKIESNSGRLLKKSENDTSFYDVIWDDRDGFIREYSDNLESRMLFLVWGLEDAKRQGKTATMTNLKNDLLATYPKGRANASIKAAFAYVEAPDTLQELAKYNRYSFAAYYLAKYFADAGAYDVAHQHLVAALSKETSPEMKLNELLLFSNVCKRCQCALPHDFDRQVTDVISTTTDTDRKATLYRILGYHYLETGEKLAGLRFLEAYLAIKPHDTKVRFDCAYQYSEAGYHSLSLHHYLIHLKTTDEPDAVTRNNLGVLYGNEGMPVKMMEAYQKAHKAGETLAGSNIASKYLAVGLVSEAQDILRKIIAEHPDGKYDERVDQVLGDIPRDISAEKDKHKSLEKSGDALSRCHAESVQSLSVDTIEWNGHWELSGGSLVLEMNEKGVKDAFVDDKKFEISFEENLGTIKKFELVGKTYYLGIIYALSKDEFKGYVVASDKTEVKELHGVRIKDFDEYSKNRTPRGLAEALLNYQKTLG